MAGETTNDKSVRLGTTKSRLFIDCVRPSDSGVYTCVAETPTRRIVTTVVLRVGELSRVFLQQPSRVNDILSVAKTDIKQAGKMPPAYYNSTRN